MPSLEFEGKYSVYAHHMTVPYRPLVPDVDRSLNPAEMDDNLIIHGDNLHALKALLPRYAGKIKCIYIDPPYNTGNEAWVYNDNVNSPMMQQWLNENKPVDGEDLERHDKWLCMMWPRLQLLKELLADDGVIFVSIDDNEHQHLRMLLDEIFGARQFIAQVIWQKKYAPANDVAFFSDNHDFILCYAKNRWEKETSIGWKRNLLPRGEKQNRLYKYDDSDGRGPWRTDNLTAKTYSADYDYPITNPNTGVAFSPTQGRSWITNSESMAKWIEDKRVFFGKNGKGRPQLKRYLSEVQQGVVPVTIWSYDEVGHTDAARKLIKEIFHERDNPFDNPKPVGLVDRILRLATDPDSIILDSFAGSGTTAHAILALNKEDGGNRKFIMVECEKYADNITAERMRRVINGFPEARDKDLQEGLGGSFTYCTLGEPLDIDRMLSGEALPSYSDLASYLLNNAAADLSVSQELAPINDDGLFHSTQEQDYYLLYEPNLAWLQSNEGILKEELARRIHKKGRKAVVFGVDKFMGQQFLTEMSITFCQIPYELHRNG